MSKKLNRDKVLKSFLFLGVIALLFFLSACVGHWTEAGVDKWRLPAGDLERKQAFLSTAMAEHVDAKQVPDGDPEQGIQALQAYGCPSCHTVPGLAGANGLVGPPLTDWSERRFIAGQIPNIPSNLIAWIQNPQAIQPDTAMPDLGVSEQDARNIAAFLYTLGQD